MSLTIHVTKASSYKGMASGCVKQMAAGVVYNHFAKVCIFFIRYCVYIMACTV